MESSQFCGRRRSDGRDAQRAERADVIKPLEKVIEKSRYGIGAGKDDPIIPAQPFESFGQWLQSVRWHDFDGGNFQNIRAAFKQIMRELARLLACARDNDPLPKQRSALEPVELASQLDDVADDRHSRRRKILLRDQVRDR